MSERKERTAGAAGTVELPGGAAGRVEGISTRVFTVPTEVEEADGTLRWDATTAIVVLARAGGHEGLGYTYGDPAVAELIESKLASLVEGADALSPPAVAAGMQHRLRNAGRPGVGAMAIAAVDIALWDLKARILGLPLADALPRFHQAVPVYGSGGFGTYSAERLNEQLDGWVEAGLGRVKIKVGFRPEQDRDRLRLTREAIGSETELFVDANGRFTPKRALGWAELYAEFGVGYLEEPVSSEDREGLRFVREHGPAGMQIAAGEYEWDLPSLARLVPCVDILQADVTRIGGITNMLRADGLAKAACRPMSAHCAPALSAHVGCALETLEHLEYFHDHVRVERELFEGTLDPSGGELRPDGSMPGHGLTLREEATAHEVAL